MASYGLTRLLWLYLGLLLTFGQGLNAIEDEVVPDPDSLGIRLDYQLYQTKPILFSSRLEFTEAPEISARQMMTLAVDAYKEMEAMTAKYNFGAAKRPNTMTTMIVGKEIFFASSVKKGETLKLGEGVEADLAACGVGTHKNQAKCGEVMTFDAYYKTNIGSEKLSKSDARIVAVMKLKKPGPNGQEYIIQPPCGEGEKWGCNRLVKDLNVLTDEKVAEDLDQTPFNWRQLKKDGKVAVTQSPTPPDDESTTDPDTSDPGKPKPPPKKPGVPGTTPDPETPPEVPGSEDGAEDGDIVPPPKHPSQNKKPNTDGQETDGAGEDGVVPPPKHPSQNKKPKPNPPNDGPGDDNAGDDGIEAPPKHPGTKPNRPTRPPTQGDGEGQPGQDGGDEDNTGTGTKPKPTKPKPTKPKSNGRTRRHFYA